MWYRKEEKEKILSFIKKIIIIIYHELFQKLKGA